MLQGILGLKPELTPEEKAEAAALATLRAAVLNEHKTLAASDKASTSTPVKRTGASAPGSSTGKAASTTRARAANNSTPYAFTDPHPDLPLRNNDGQRCFKCSGYGHRSKGCSTTVGAKCGKHHSF